MTSLALFKAAGKRLKFILSQLPQYLTTSCCIGAGHVLNRDNTDFGEKIMDDLAVLKHQIKDFCHINHLGRHHLPQYSCPDVQSDRRVAVGCRGERGAGSATGTGSYPPCQDGYHMLATNLME